jgi:hypothetical protein
VERLQGVAEGTLHESDREEEMLYEHIQQVHPIRVRVVFGTSRGLTPGCGERRKEL